MATGRQGRGAFEGQKCDLGTDSNRTRAGTRQGSRIEVVREGRRGAIGLRLVLLSCFLSLSDHAPLASYRLGSSVRVVRYGRALRAVQEVVAKSRRNPDEISLALVAHRGSSRTRGRRKHFRTSDKTRRVVEVRYV